MTTQDPKKPTRKELYEVFQSPRLVRAFEQLFDLVPLELEDDGSSGDTALAGSAEAQAGVLRAAQEIGIVEAVFDAKAAMALSLIDRLTQAVETLAYAPPRGDLAFDGGIVPASEAAQLSPEVLPPHTPSQLIDSDLYVNGYLVLPKTAGKGIRVDKVDPTDGWRDLLTKIETRPAAGGGAAAVPDYVAYRGNIYGWRFGTNAPNNHLHEAFCEFHIPHDWVHGSDMYIHVHWSQTVADTGGGGAVPGVSKWYLDVTYADGHGTAGGAADAFFAPITISVTQQASTTAYGHMIAETQLSSNGGSGGTLLDSSTIQVDGLILCRVYRDPTDAADTLNQDTFVHFVDIHYQTTNIGTKQKAPDFYT